MNRSVVFQPAWNAVKKWQFRHLERSAESRVVQKCTCVECGHEFGVQREGAMYLCERCVSKEA